MKKFLKIAGIVVLLLIVALFALPYLFKDAIKAKIAATINENVDAVVSFDDADISLLRSFPQANVTIDKLLIINKAPFAGDTLVSLGEISLDMSVKELFKGKTEPINVDGFTSTNGVVNIIFNKDGVGNYDIAMKNAEKKDATESDPVLFKIKEYSIDNLRFKYLDEASEIGFTMDSLYHTGSGDFTSDKLDLKTQSETKMSLNVGKSNYMNKIPLKLDAVLGIDMKNQIYSFKQNKATINQLPLEFDGSIKMIEDGQDYDLTFKTPTSSFKNLLALIPAEYSGSIEKVETSGNFAIIGFAKGIYSDTTVPKFNLAITSNDGTFKYPNLPKSVRNIVVDAKIINDTGILNDTYVNLDKLTFAIDQDVFNAKANVRNIIKNALVNAELKGTINLSNLSRAYPIKLDKPLSGVLVADVVTKFDMESVEKSQYQNIDNSGNMSLSRFNYDNDGTNVNISEAKVQFNPSRVNLQQLVATTGKSDISATGTLDNFYGFLFSDQVLKGTFNTQSNQIAISDFMSDETTAKTPGAKTAMKIPAFLDCVVTAKANTVLYDNLVLKNVAGKVTIRDQKATLENVTTNIFGGLVGVTGNVSTKGNVPTFSMNLNLKAVDIAQSFTQLDMLRNIAPIAGVVNGKLNSNISVAGNLDRLEMTPDLKSMTGNLQGQLLSTTINASNSSFLTALDNNLKFIDLNNVNLNDLKAALSFDKGNVIIKPLTIAYKDVKVNVGGQHGFDQTMKYNLSFDVPAKYLGTEANALLAKLTPAEAAQIKNVPVKANITGSFKNPKISTDMKQAVTSLTNQLVQMQKDKLINQGKGALSNILSGNKAPKDPKDTTATKPATTNEQIKDKASQALKDLFGKKKPAPKPPAN